MVFCHRFWGRTQVLSAIDIEDDWLPIQLCFEFLRVIKRMGARQKSSASSTLALSSYDPWFLWVLITKDSDEFSNTIRTQSLLFISEVSGQSFTLEKQPVGKVNSTKIVRPTFLKSPFPSASAFESAEGSDDVDLADNFKLNSSYFLANGYAVSIFQTMLGHMSAIVEQNHVSAASMIHSNSVSADLRGVHLDPIATDIIRKEHTKVLCA
ncbi:hypothetical protein C5167_041466 [Papaver somniferum]|nr:hypothetical protein C5167_041466 [Papaver somniferum]